jgi:hypothetical protein
MATALAAPVIAPPDSVGPGPTRDLLTALHEHGWLMQLPAFDGWAILVSPDGSRSMRVEIDRDATDLDRLAAYIDGTWLPTAWAATYVREG